MRAPEVRIRPLTAASLPSTNCSDRIKTSASIALAFWSTSSAVGSIVSVLIVLSIGARRSGSSMPSDLTSPAVTLSTDWTVVNKGARTGSRRTTARVDMASLTLRSD